MDINKGDNFHTGFRPRVVGQAMKLLFSLAVPEGIGYEKGNKSHAEGAPLGDAGTSLVPLSYATANGVMDNHVVLIPAVGIQHTTGHSRRSGDVPSTKGVLGGSL